MSADGTPVVDKRREINIWLNVTFPLVFLYSGRTLGGTVTQRAMGRLRCSKFTVTANQVSEDRLVPFYI